MIAIAEQVLDEMVEVIVREVDPERIILFGSRARDEETVDSDVDLLIIEDQPFGPGRSRRQEMARLWRLLARFALPKDILVYSQSEVERWRYSKNHIIARALREGKLLYERH